MKTQRLHTPQWFPNSTNSMLFGFVKMLNELRCLTSKNSTMIEIGSHMGESTMLFASSNIFNKIYTIDPHTGDEIFNKTHGYSWDDIKKQFELNTRYFHNISLISDYSFNVADRFDDNSIDFIYLDGAHDYESVKRDLQLYLPKLKPRGIIGGHDYNDNDWPETCKAIHDIVGIPDTIFEDSSWIKQKYKKISQKRLV